MKAKHGEHTHAHDVSRRGHSRKRAIRNANGEARRKRSTDAARSSSALRTNTDGKRVGASKRIAGTRINGERNSADETTKLVGERFVRNLQPNGSFHPPKQKTKTRSYSATGAQPKRLALCAGTIVKWKYNPVFLHSCVSS
jgi:hypothetical protein